MLPKFKQINSHYKNFHQALEDRGQLTYRLTHLGAWAPSRAHHVFFFFRTLDLSRYRLCLDLGSGDGIVTCIAGLFTRAVGIEIDRDLCSVASRTAHDLELDSRVSFMCGDYRSQRIQQADCLYIYPEQPLIELETLLSRWQGALLVYGHHFPPLRFLPVLLLKCGRERLTIYRNPQ